MNETPLPLYYKLYNSIKEDFENDKYQKGDKLPTEKEICENYNVSRLTVRRALDELKREGLIDRKKGKGTFFTGKKREEQMSKLRGFTDDVQNSGSKTKSVVLENKLVKAETEFDGIFKTPKDSRVLMLKRIRYINDEPYAIETAYLNPLADLRVLNVIDRDMSKESLYHIFQEEFELEFAYAEETLEITVLDKDESDILQQKKGAPAALRTRYTYLKNGQCIEYVKSIYRGDKYKFKVVKKI